MGLFRKRETVDPKVVDQLRDELQLLRGALDQADSDRVLLRQQLEEFLHRPAPAAADVEVRGRVDALTSSLKAMDTLRERIDGVQSEVEQTKQLEARLASIEQRVDNVTTELANQITELGGDIDTMASTPPPTPAGLDDETVARLAALGETQTRLANEQARYQIAFREDLAKLAEQIRSNQRR